MNNILFNIYINNGDIMIIYLTIMISKIIENALATLRLIVVANGKKKLGALLQGIVALIWILVAGVVIIDINKDILKIIFFCLGSAIGSYLGSFIEEKIALGNSLLTCIIETRYENKIRDVLKSYKINTVIDKDSNYTILFIFSKRKDIYKLNKIIKKIDSKAIIICEKAKSLNNIV